MKKYFKIIILLVAFVFMFSFINVYAEDGNTVTNDGQLVSEAPNDDLDEEVDDTGEETDDYEHRAAVIINKLDENGNPLVGAVLQILNSEGLVEAEWTSSEESFAILLPEGTYTLHEVSAPEGYKIADDETFVVEIKMMDLDAGVDFSNTPCEHYEGTPLYYVNINGVKEEAYCINQDWETPDEDSNYDGAVLNSDNIRDYTQQTVYIDAHQNTGKVDVSDQSLESDELYNKILDIIYRRQLATDLFSDLSEAEIRYITESALKNFTNAGLTRVQRVVASQAPENYDLMDSYKDGRFIWYLYPWYRSFIYDPTQPLGSDIYITSVGNGDAFGTLARHWSDVLAHNAKNDETVRQQVARYYELYQYLVNGTTPHPEEMELFIFSTNNTSSDSSRYNFDEGAYQNLLGVRWHTPEDDNIVEIDFVNKPEIIPPVTSVIATNTNRADSSLFILILLGLEFGLIIKKRFN